VAIDTKHVKTDVLVENGGTVVIGGIYAQDERKTQTRIPFLGDLPYIGFLFRNTTQVNNRSELLIFITPRVVTDALTAR
ncbi:MAG: type IV pilus secretin PilQ, partial [Rhodocyclaceae bacterium]|nr:type IV pilus secretin PilQ [Rhodocyclaceae bacterium]